METMYQRIKRMSEGEMRTFIYMIYLCGNKDGKDGLEDSPDCSYFGDGFLHVEAQDLMPNDDVADLYKSWSLD